MKAKYFTCKEWQMEKSFLPVLMICGEKHFLMGNGKKRPTTNHINMFTYGDKLQEISEAEAVLLI